VSSILAVAACAVGAVLLLAVVSDRPDAPLRHNWWVLAVAVALFGAAMYLAARWAPWSGAVVNPTHGTVSRKPDREE
jgi:hypothetical protein